MKITSCTIYRYHLPFHKPIAIRGASKLHGRMGFLIRIRESGGMEGWGEIAPLPGLSRESMASIEQQIKRIKESTIGTNMPPLANLMPSVRFGIELAYEDLKANLENKSLFHELTDDRYKVVSVNRVLQGTQKEILRDAEEALELGYKTVKLKATATVKTTIETLEKLNALLKSRVRIRVDANQAWSLEQAVLFGRSVRSSSIEYIEEPVATAEDRKAFFEETKMPYALDESLMGKVNLRQEKGLKAVVLKPMALGGFDVAFKIANEARSLGAKAIISSTIESGIGTRGLAFFAAAVNYDNDPVGLDPYLWLKEDVFAPRIEMLQGEISLSSLKKMPKVDLKLLEEIT